MKRADLLSLCPLAVTLAIAGCNAGGNTSLPTTVRQSTVAQGHPIPEWQAKHLAQAACPAVGPGEAQCAALVMNEGVGPATAPGGWGPSDFRAVYKLPSSSKGSGEIVGIVDAYDNPNVASDLAQYRSTYGIPPREVPQVQSTRDEQSHYPRATKVGVSRSTSTWRWFRRPVPSARFISSRRRTTACAISGERSSERRNLARTSSAIVGDATRRVAPGRPAPSIGRT